MQCDRVPLVLSSEGERGPCQRTVQSIGVLCKYRSTVQVSENRASIGVLCKYWSTVQVSVGVLCKYRRTVQVSEYCASISELGKYRRTVQTHTTVSANCVNSSSFLTIHSSVSFNDSVDTIKHNLVTPINKGGRVLAVVVALTVGAGGYVQTCPAFQQVQIAGKVSGEVSRVFT